MRRRCREERQSEAWKAFTLGMKRLGTMTQGQASGYSDQDVRDESHEAGFVPKDSISPSAALPAGPAVARIFP